MNYYKTKSNIPGTFFFADPDNIEGRDKLGKDV